MACYLNIDLYLWTSWALCKAFKVNYSSSPNQTEVFLTEPSSKCFKRSLEEELDRLVDLGVVEKMRYSEWAVPIVPFVKPDNSIRVCGDDKVTFYSVLEVDQHLLPKPEELFVELSGEKNSAS